MLFAAFCQYPIKMMVSVGRCEMDYVRLYLDVDDTGINELTDWAVELCGNDTRTGSAAAARHFYSSSSRAILELHTNHHRRHHQRQHHQSLQQQQQLRQHHRPQFRGFRGTFRFLRKG